MLLRPDRKTTNRPRNQAIWWRHLRFRSHWWIFGEERLAAAGACVSSDTSGRPPAKLPMPMLASSPRSRRGWLQPQVLASQYTSGLQQVTCLLPSMSTERQYYTVALVKNMLTGDAFQTSASKLTCSWCLLADVSFEFKLSALQGKCLLSYTSWFQPPKPLLEINLNHWTSALEPKPKSTILMPSITNMLFFKILLWLVE